MSCPNVSLFQGVTIAPASGGVLPTKEGIFYFRKPDSSLVVGPGYEFFRVTPASGFKIVMLMLGTNGIGTGAPPSTAMVQILGPGETVDWSLSLTDQPFVNSAYGSFVVPYGFTLVAGVAGTVAAGDKFTMALIGLQIADSEPAPGVDTRPLVGQ